MNENTNENNETTIDGKVEEALLEMIDQRVSALTIRHNLIQSQRNTHLAKNELLEIIIKELQDGGNLFDSIESIVDAQIDNIEYDDFIDERIGYVIDSDYIMDNLDHSELGSNIMDAIDMSDYIDTDEVASEVMNNIDISDYIDMDEEVRNRVQEWIDSGCSSVDDYCEKIIERANRNNNNVILTQSQFKQIMEVVEIIRPQALHLLKPQDLANRLVEQVNTDAITLVSNALVYKTQKDAEKV